LSHHIWNDTSAIYRNNGTIYWPIEIEKDRRFEYITFGLIDLGAQFLSSDTAHLKLGVFYEEKHTEKALEIKLTGFASASAYLWRWLHFQKIQN
ncbi:MAG: hypothetical protein KDC53_17310, partial [Saprospiraceae bacterium]|nr:hypothetical protein [Saprospiraceae bacterium]